MRYRLITVMVLIVAAVLNIQAQSTYWQQRVEYDMDIKMDVEKNQFSGTQKLVYYNNSPEELTQVFYHLYFNAFQPGSMMDIRSRSIADPDSRVDDRIYDLQPDEIGYHKIKSLKQNGKPVEFEVVGTILEVQLAKPIKPGTSATFEMVFESQVPKQIRRSGRDNNEGIRFSMTQWYPKMCEYDHRGWHSNPYIGREFHGVWGDFDVKINIDPKYVIGGTGYLQNPEQIGHGYLKKGAATGAKGANLTWHFKAEDVHDFAWAADPDYLHTTAQVPDGPTLHFIYQNDEEIIEKWEKLPDYTVKAFQFMNEHYGKYPYDQYTVIQGGDGGMEYPMATLITGKRSVRSLVGVTIHELIHSWFQGVLGTNESLFPWMDEGFTTFATAETRAFVFEEEGNPHGGTYAGYYRLAKGGKEEPMTTHSDHYEYNQAYGAAAYSKGAVLLNQLRYIVGEVNFENGMKRYFNTWKFKHPETNDFKRIMELESGMNLNWYFEQFVNTTNTIDYGLRYLVERKGKSYLTVKRNGKMMMPLEILVTYADGSREMFYIPLRMMRAAKTPNDKSVKWTQAEDWPWVMEEYTLEIPKGTESIKSIEIDPSKALADIDKDDNTIDVEARAIPYQR